MNVVIVLFKKQGSCQLLFDKYDHAVTAYEILRTAMKSVKYSKSETYPTETPEIRDDYGTMVSIDGRDIEAVIAQDLHRHFEGVTLYELEQKRSQAVLQKKIAADPTLRLLTPAGPMSGVMHG